MIRVVLSLGSNLGDKEKNIKNAIHLLSDTISNLNVSRYLTTQAILKDEAPKEWDREFINCIVVGFTNLSPVELLDVCKKIEKKMGRDLNSPIWSPRIIDVDIINYGNLKLITEALTIPHKEIKNRRFIEDLYYEISDINLQI